MEVRRGEVFYADLSPVVGSEQGGIRPVLIIQNDVGNRHSPTVIAAAITSRQDKNRLPTHIGVRGRPVRTFPGQYRADRADPHTGQTPPSGKGRLHPARRYAPGGRGPGRLDGAAVPGGRTPYRRVSALAFAAQQPAA